VYAFGCAYDGRLGLGGPRRSSRLAAGNAQSPQHIIRPTKLVDGALSGGVHVRDISAGAHSSVAVLTDGRVVSWGRGALGQSKIIDDESGNQPSVVTLPNHMHIRQASAGFEHMLLVGADGSAYSFGYGTGGALGHGCDETDKLIPTKIDALEGVNVRIAEAGETHSLVVDVNGAVYEFGVENSNAIDYSDMESEDDEQDTPDEDPRGLPKLIEERGRHGWTAARKSTFFTGLRAMDVAAGSGTSAFRSAGGLTSSGGEYTDTHLYMEAAEWPGADEKVMVAAVEAEEAKQNQLLQDKAARLNECVVS